MSLVVRANDGFLCLPQANSLPRKGLPEVARVTYLRLEIAGPRTVFVTGDVDLTGDDTESHVAVRLRALEAKFCASPAVVGTVLSLSAPDEPSLRV